MQKDQLLFDKNKMKKGNVKYIMWEILCYKCNKTNKLELSNAKLWSAQANYPLADS